GLLDALSVNASLKAGSAKLRTLLLPALRRRLLGNRLLCLGLRSRLWSSLGRGRLCRRFRSSRRLRRSFCRRLSSRFRRALRRRFFQSSHVTNNLPFAFSYRLHRETRLFDQRHLGKTRLLLDLGQ